MKIKIKKNSKVLKERYAQSPTSIKPLEELFNDLGLMKDGIRQLESIFQKDLLFYDLETTGLKRSQTEGGAISDMIHQIAILKYSPNGDPNSINPESPDDYYVAKATITEEYSDRSSILKKDRAKILNQTSQGSYADYKGMIGEDLSFNKNPREFEENYQATEKEKQEQKNDMKETLGLFFHVLLNHPVKSQAKKTIYQQPKFRTLFNKALEYASTIKLQDEVETILLNKNPNRQQLIYLYDNVLSEDSVEGGITTWLKSIGESKNAKKVDQIIKLVNITIEENKVFTNYGDFPLKKYQNESFKGPISEKEALEGMMDFIDNQGNKNHTDDAIRGDYILVGQNIISFDNPFVIARCKFHGITNTKNFRNSHVYDTRFLFQAMIKYFRTFGYFYGLAETAHLRQAKLESYMQDEEDPKKINAYKKAIMDFQRIKSFKDPKLRKVGKEVRGILKKLAKGGKAKGKLETLMKAFIPNAPKQTHTADDDCEKLATVMIPAIEKFYEIYQATFPFVVEMDRENVVAIYRIVKDSPIDPKTKTKKKTIPSEIDKDKAAIGFQKFKGAGDIADKVASKFAEDLSFAFLDDEGKPSKELAKQIIKIYLQKREGLSGSMKDSEKLEIFNNYENFTEDDTIEWFTKHQDNLSIIYTPVSKIKKMTKLEENRKTLKIKILKERNYA